MLRLTRKGQRLLKAIHGKADLQFRNTLWAIEVPKRPIVIQSLQLFAQALSTTRRLAAANPRPKSKR